MCPRTLARPTRHTLLTHSLSKRRVRLLRLWTSGAPGGTAQAWPLVATGDWRATGRCSASCARGAGRLKREAARSVQAGLRVGGSLRGGCAIPIWLPTGQAVVGSDDDASRGTQSAHVAPLVWHSLCALLTEGDTRRALATPGCPTDEQGLISPGCTHPGQLCSRHTRASATRRSAEMGEPASRRGLASVTSAPGRPLSACHTVHTPGTPVLLHRLPGRQLPCTHSTVHSDIQGPGVLGPRPRGH